MQTTTISAAEEAEQKPSAGGGVQNHYLQQAEDYIRANLRAPFSLRDLTETTGTSPSTLLRAFNTHHGVSPMQYVKMLRLQAVRRSLLDSDPLRGTVGGIASEYGFRQLGRFSADYRKVCGELPSVTLRRHRRGLSDTKGL